MSKTVPVGTLWVCTCCLFAREGDGDGCDGNGGCEGNPWAELADTDEVTLGLTFEEHSCEPGAEECDCERKEFSWSSCDGCGSSLGGHRQAYTLWQANR